MKVKIIPVVALLACVATGVSAALPVTLAKFSNFNSQASGSAKITGDYVEARTASVFAGPCHFNGELVTTGRDAVMAWSFASGTFNGIDLSGVRAVAAVTSDENLGDGNAPRKTELVVDSDATDQQTSAVASLLRSRLANQLGEIVAVHRTPITFTHTDNGYTVNAQGFATMDVNYRTDNSCCLQPALVWYSPLSPLEHRKVGFTQVATFSGSVAEHWQRTEEDSAFYGSMAF
jgi:hypothetical protein